MPRRLSARGFEQGAIANKPVKSPAAPETCSVGGWARGAATHAPRRWLRGKCGVGEAAGQSTEPARSVEAALGRTRGTDVLSSALPHHEEGRHPRQSGCICLRPTRRLEASRTTASRPREVPCHVRRPQAAHADKTPLNRRLVLAPQRERTHVPYAREGAGVPGFRQAPPRATTRGCRRGRGVRRPPPRPSPPSARECP